MKLRTKLFVLFTGLSLLLLILLVVMLRWSFGRGAEAYILKEDRADLEWLRTELIDWYALHPSFAEFYSAGAWQQWLLAHNPSASKSSSSNNVQNSRHTKPFILFDAHHHLIAGATLSPDRSDAPPPRDSSMDTVGIFSDEALFDDFSQDNAADSRAIGVKIPVDVDGQRIGYLALPKPPHRLGNFWNDSLVNQSFDLLVTYSGMALLVSLFVAGIFSSRWVSRILTLHRYVGELMQGRYGGQVGVKGRDEMAELSRQLNELSLRLAANEKQRKQLTADISHELRTPIANLRATLEAIKDGVLPMSTDYVDALIGQVLRLNQLVEDVYQLALADAGALHCSKCPLELPPLLARLTDEYQLRFNERGLNLRFIPAVDSSNAPSNTKTPLTIDGDAQRLTQLFSNILENSLRYTDAPGQVRIYLRQDHDQRLSVTVEDSAPGVPEAYQAQLTDRLFRMENSRNRASGGAGLGLNLCDALAQLHNAELRIASSELGGLAVSVHFPLSLAV